MSNIISCKKRASVTKLESTYCIKDFFQLRGDITNFWNSLSFTGKLSLHSPSALLKSCLLILLIDHLLY